MKQISGQSSATVGTEAHDAFRFLEAIEDYPSWHPDVVREVTVLERDNRQRATRAATRLHLAIGPFNKEVEAELAVEIESSTRLSLTRLEYDNADHERFQAIWQIDPVSEGTRIGLAIEARLDVPRLIPLGGAGQAMTESFVSAVVRALATRPAGTV